MQLEHYYGTYARFDTLSKKEAGALLGPDNLVGDIFSISLKLENGVYTAWVINKFDKTIGYLNEETSQTLSILSARKWELKAILSFVAFTDAPEPGQYWGEVAVVAYDSQFKAELNHYIQNTTKRIMDGIRPNILLTENSFTQLIDSNGTWQPTKTIPLPKKETGTAILKSRRKLNEKMIEQGRNGNKGCYFISWIFLLGIVALIIFGLHSFGII